MKYPSHEWFLTNSDFPTNQTFHQFHDIYTELDLHRLWVVSMDHLQRVWHASMERLPFRTPGSVPHCGTCFCSNCWDQIPRACHVFTRLFTSNTPWYFLDFAFKSRFISNSSHCSTTIFSKHITSALTAVKDHVIKYSETAFINSNVNYTVI